MKDLLKRITVDPEICHGKPTIRGLRYIVTNVLELMAAGMTKSEILMDYEDLEELDLQACLLWAVELSKAKSISKLIT